MKKSIILSILTVVCLGILSSWIYLLVKSDNLKEVTAASISNRGAYYGTDGDLVMFPSEGVKGTEKNPFVILEIVPYEGFAELGYWIEGCEPIATEEMMLVNGAAGFYESTKQMKVEWKLEYAFDLKEEDYDNDGKPKNGWEYVGWTTRKQYGYFNKVEKGKGKYTLKITDVIKSEGIVKIVPTEDTKEGDYIWIGDANSENILSNKKTAESVKDGDKIHTGFNRNYYQRYRNFFTHHNYFLKTTLGLTEEEIYNYYVDSAGKTRGYNIKVLTITPEELNLEKNQGFIDRADLISFSPKHHISGFPEKWEEYHPDKKKANYKKNLSENDLTWETTIKILETNIGNKKVPLLFDSGIYNETLNGNNGRNYSKDNTFKIEKKYKDGTKISLQGNAGISNVCKLYLIMQQMNPGQWYNEYVKTGLVVSVPVKDFTNSSKLIKDSYGTILTTGSYTELKGDGAIYWFPMTFLPYHLFNNYNEVRDNKVWLSLGIDLDVLYNGSSSSNQSVRKNFYSFNGDNSILMSSNIKNIAENKYRKEAFDYYEKTTEIRPNNISTLEAIYFLLKQSSNNKTYYKDSIHILELSPSNDFIWDGTNKEFSMSVRDGNGSEYARKYYYKFFPNYEGKIKITTMTSAEFIGKKEDLNVVYDLVLMTLKDGGLRKNTSGKTIYNTSSFDGKVYLSTGDTIVSNSKSRGVLSGDSDTVDIYRFSGNDITKVKLQELIDFVNGGYPILLDGDFYSGNTVNSTKIEGRSKVYSLLNGQKGKLFDYSTMNLNEFEQALGKKKIQIRFAKVESPNVEEKEFYPKVYKDKTRAANAGLSDKDIYINVPNENNRTLQYKFFIDGIQGEENASYRLKLYIDINADGKYDTLTEEVSNLFLLTEDGKSASPNNLKANINYTLNRALEVEYNGVLPWKLEITKVGNSSHRHSIENHCALKTKEKIKLNILQITPNSNVTVNLSTHNLFKKYTTDLLEYDLNFTTWTVDQFSSRCGNGAYRYILKDDKDNNGVVVNPREKKEGIDDNGDGFYEVDMVILGFGDMYSDISNENALRNIEDFIHEGKSILFTHDTTSFVNLSKSKYGDGDYWGYHLNKRMRDTLGMDRYGVTLPADKRAGKDTSDDKYIQGFTDIHLNRYSYKDKGGKVQYSSNPNISLTGNLDITTSYVTSINKGQITSYPYEIDENFQVATTHGQYYQLDLEANDIVVWYCLSDGKSKKISSTGTDKGLYSSVPNDARNNYYIYNKGNITYSGVGHSSLNLDMEVKLFVNTMIAAYSATAKAPNISLSNTNRSTDQNGLDSVYVNYDIYNTDKAYSNDIYEKSGGQVQRIMFRINENNILFNKKITLQYFEITEGINPDGSPKRIETEIKPVITKRTSDDVVVTDVLSGEEYYIDIPLNYLTDKNRSKTFSIKAIITYGKSSDKVINSYKDFVLVRRSLFDLD